jgi:ABC-type dipeptide/oligopeptide/nickel transport system ATPase subunit
MEILDSKLKKQVGVVSRKLGLNPREVVNRAVSSYLGSMKELTDLQKELRIWDILSAEGLRKHKF